MTSPENLLIVGDSESDADILYATRFFVTVPVMYLECAGKKTLLVNDLEYGRAITEAKVDEVVSTTPYEERLRAEKQVASLAGVLDLYLKEKQIRTLTVPASFPFGHAEKLREKGYELKLREDPFFPERAIKRPDEIAAIEESQRTTEAAMELAVSRLSSAEIRGDWLYSGGEPLTSEKLRLDIHRFFLERGFHAQNTIIAGADQGADPHQRGSGPLPANKTIILDIFPQSIQTRYWGDMTRTVVRGKATPAVRKLYQDVLDAQQAAISMIRDGVDCARVHEEVAQLFRSRGNRNEETGGKKTGYIHSTGHGLGLEIHEWPRIGKSSARLLAGQVVTVEPGLYYPGVGAVRLEDVVVVTRDGCRNLNRFPKELEV